MEDFSQFSNTIVGIVLFDSRLGTYHQFRAFQEIYSNFQVSYDSKT